MTLLSALVVLLPGRVLAYTSLGMLAGSAALHLIATAASWCHLTDTVGQDRSWHDPAFDLGGASARTGPGLHVAGADSGQSCAAFDGDGGFLVSSD